MSHVRLFLIRHGNTFESHDVPVMVGSQTDMALTHKGLAQAKDMAMYFEQNKIQIDHLICGGLLRQQQMAQALCERFPHLSPKSEAAFDEIDYGEWEGLTPEQVKKTWPKDYERWVRFATWPKTFGQSGNEKRKVLLDWIDDAKETMADKTVVIATSQGVIKLFVSLYPALWEKNDLEAFRVKTGHFCELTLADTVTIEQWNQPPLSLGTLA